MGSIISVITKRRKKIHMKKNVLFGLTLLASIGFMTACGSNKAVSAKADGMPEKITIVTMPDENNPEAGGKNKKFQEDMSKALGIEVDVMEGADYAVGIEAMKNKKLDVLLVSPMSYYQAKERVEIEPIVTTSSAGKEAYRTVFITKKDNDKINKLKDLKGTNFAFVDPASSSGYLYPKYELVKELDLEQEKVEEPNYFFKTVAYSGKHDSSVMGVAKGDYEAAAVAAQVLQSMDDAGLVKKDELKIIGETQEIPNAAYVMRKDLPEELKKKIKDFYLNYDDKEYFKAFYKDDSVKFVEAHDTDYESVKEMMKVLGIEGEK